MGPHRASNQVVCLSSDVDMHAGTPFTVTHSSVIPKKKLPGEMFEVVGLNVPVHLSRDFRQLVSNMRFVQSYQTFSFLLLLILPPNRDYHLIQVLFANVTN